MSQDHTIALQPGDRVRFLLKKKKKNATDLCAFILYPESLLKLFVKSKSLFKESLGFSRYMIISSVNRDNPTSCFPVFAYYFFA